MTRIAAAIAVILPVIVVSTTDISNAAAGDTDSAHSNPCAVPNEIINSADETAWRIWVAAACPVNSNQYPYVVWENWIEQGQLYPDDPSQGLKVPNSGATAAAHVLHPSPLTLFRHPTSLQSGLLGAPNTNCNAANAPPPPNTPPPPPNTNNNPLTICEEVREGGAAEDYIAGTGFWNRANQATAAADRFDVQFPGPAVEIKADWIQLSTLGPLGQHLDCSNLPPGFAQTIHIETVDGSCFALAGMHLISKLIDKWIWATFEPQNSTTNPFRCQVLGCNDPFGSKPAKTNGANTQLTEALQRLMQAADLAPEWYNYRLDGVQTDFNQPRLLGSSIIEGENVGMPLNQASCISCHAVSSVRSDGFEGINLLTSNPVGFPQPLPSKQWIRRDFVWSLGVACPNGPHNSMQAGSLNPNCTSTLP
jgi:hypothetical protein